jgi:hypothetical protein
MSGFMGILLAAGYDTSAQTIFDAFTTPPTAPRRTYINNCVVALKGAGLWTKLDGLWMFAAADSQAGLINWKTPGTFDATAVNSPTHTADQGFATDPTGSKYLDTNLVLNTGGINYQQDSASFGFWSRTSGQQTGVNDMAWFTAVPSSSLIGARSNTDTSVGRNNQLSASTTISVANTDGSGLFHNSRTGSGGFDLYRNGASIGTSSTTASTTVPALDFFIGTGNSFGSPGTIGTRQYAMGFVAAGMDATEASNFYSAILAYMQAVGAA